MNVIVYIIPTLFSMVMLINGAIRYWGHFDSESMEAIFYHYIPTKREKRNWRFSQKIHGKYLLLASLLNVATEIVLIPLTKRLLEARESSEYMSIGILAIVFLPSFGYMFGAWVLMQLKLKQLEDADKKIGKN